MVKKEIIDESQVQVVLNKITTHTDINDGVKEADLVIEAATENEALKLKIFGQIDQAAPANAILASNTSSISIQMKRLKPSSILRWTLTKYL